MINDLKPIKKSWPVYKRLLKSASCYWPMFLLGFIGTILASGADAGLSWLVKPLVDQGLVARNKVFIVWMPVLIIVGFVIRGLMLFLSNYCITRVGRNVIMDYRQKIFNHLLKLPATFFDKETSGQLLSLFLYNTDQLSFAITDAVLTILQEGLQLVGLVVVMFVISWKLTLIFMVTTPPIYITIRYATQRLRTLNNRVQRSVGDIAHVAEEMIQGYRVIRIFGGEGYERDKFKKISEYNRHCEMKVVVTNSISTSIVQIIACLPIAFILYIINIPALHVSVGSFAAMIGAMARLLTPVRRLTKINTDMQKGIAAANSIFNLLDHPPEKDTGTKHIERASGHIEYRNVSFKYPQGHKKVLHDINFSIKAGQTIALVGRSGGGKSTLVSLLPRFYDPTSGSIYIDGAASTEYKLKELRNQFSLVSQNIVLFNDTIANNIAYGRMSTTDRSTIEKTVQAAYLTDFIQQLPDGLDTLIGENGLLLSGGQRQRIAIARAILKDAPILILDEATASLDTESERYIQSALEALMHKCTTLVIAHRLSTVERADKIMVVDQGQIVESGNHHELIAQNGQYAKLYKMQFKK